MKIEDIFELETINAVAKKTGLSANLISVQKNVYGFSANSVRAFLKVYPELDVFDMLFSYPKKNKQNR